jgi:heme oxygenase
MDPESEALESPGSSIDNSSTGEDETDHEKPTGQTNPRVHAVLSDLYLPDLMRTSRLKEDIGVLTGWPRHVVEEQLDAVAQTGRLSEFLSHIKRAVGQKPHVLMAYSYIMFMALFAGGRFIRASLESAGDEFWKSVPSIAKAPPAQRDSTATVTPEHDGRADPHDQANGVNTSAAHHDSPFCFFHFSTPNDGEDLKLEFKSRLSRAEETLTERERREIVQEAVCIFDNMRLLVQQLDIVSAGPGQGDVNTEGAMDTFSQLFKNPLVAKFRDSVVVTKERAARMSSKLASNIDDMSKKPYNEGYPIINGPGSPGSNHPPIPGLSSGQLCPAMAKSMRFEKSTASPHALRLQSSSDNLHATFVGSTNRAARGVYGIGMTNLIVAFVLGAVFVCALLYGRGVHSLQT